MSSLWPLPKNTLSPSSLKTFEQCAESFRRKYVKGERDPSSWSTILGSAVHGAQEVNLGQKRVTLKDLPLAELEDIYSQKYEDEIEESGGISSINWRRGNGDVILPSKAKDIARPVNQLYHQQVAPTIMPLATEQWIRIRLPGLIPTIVGKVDVMILNGGKVDLKFGGSAMQQPRKDWLMQAAIYNLADNTPFEWHSGSWGSSRSGPAVFTPANAPALRLASSPEDKKITERLIRSYAAAIVAYYNTFGPDEPWPGNGKSHTFACDYCPFHPSKGGACAYWPRVPVAQPAKPRTEATLL